MPPQLRNLMDSYFSESKFTVEEHLVNFYSLGEGGCPSEVIMGVDFQRVDKVKGYKVWISIHLAEDVTIKILNIGFPEAFYTDSESIVRFIKYMAYEFI